MMRIFSKQLPSLVKYFSNSYVIQSLHMSAPASTKVALVLSGSGVYDGSEIHEASAYVPNSPTLILQCCLVHLSRAGADVSMYAPNVDQMHVIDHIKGQEMEGEKRNVLVESARIARGNIHDLANIKAESYDAIIFPGGFGAAKNLCNWAVENANCTVNNEVKSTIEKFHLLKKPIGLCCIAPVLAAKCIPSVELTVGHSEEEGGRWPYAGTAAAMEQCGAKHVMKDVSESHVDVTNKVVTTPAYMCNAPVHQIFDGVGTMISEVLKLVKG